MPSTPVSAMHDNDLVHFDLIQVTKPSTDAHFTKVFRAAPGQICVDVRHAFCRKGGRAQSPVGEMKPVDALKGTRNRARI
jgi:hypothetical protein